MKAYKINAFYPGCHWSGTVIISNDENIEEYCFKRFGEECEIHNKKSINLEQVNIIDLTAADLLKILKYEKNIENETKFKFKNIIKFKFKCVDCRYLTNEKTTKCLCGHNNYIENK